jgi:homoserine kinase
MRFLVRTPATVANLGPGFDCLGLALDLWNEMEISTMGDHLHISIEGEGCDILPRDESNTIYRAMHSFALRQGKTLPAGIQIRCFNKIPLGSGLGSSSAAAVAGILAAAALLDVPDNKEAQLDFATQIEGHSDNVTPCLLGGLTISLIDKDRVVAKQIQIHPFPLVIVTPAFDFPTKTARAALPETIAHKDAVFNLARVVLLAEVLKIGDFDLISLAVEDRLHQPYRIPLVPGAAAAISAARDAGAVAVVLAGAGPGLLAFVRDNVNKNKIAEAMVDAFRQVGLNTRTYSPSISIDGASVQAS